MTFFKTKKATLRQLQYLNIADENGALNTQKFSEFKKQQLEKGYNIYVDKKEFKGINGVNIIDNEDTEYNGKKYKSGNMEID